MIWFLSGMLTTSVMPPASMKGMEMKKYGKGLLQTSVYRIKICYTIKMSLISEMFLFGQKLSICKVIYFNVSFFFFL